MGEVGAEKPAAGMGRSCLPAAAAAAAAARAGARTLARAGARASAIALSAATRAAAGRPRAVSSRALSSSAARAVLSPSSLSHDFLLSWTRRHASPSCASPATPVPAAPGDAQRDRIHGGKARSGDGLAPPAHAAERDAHAHQSERQRLVQVMNEIVPEAESRVAGPLGLLEVDDVQDLVHERLEGLAGTALQGRMHRDRAAALIDERMVQLRVEPRGPLALLPPAHTPGLSIRAEEMRDPHDNTRP